VEGLVEVDHLVVKMLPPQAKRGVEADDLAVDGEAILDAFADD
jgi:hypothetical protein